MIKFLYQGNDVRLSKYLKKHCPFISFTAYKELVNRRDIKINSVRICSREDAELKSGDEVALYYPMPFLRLCFEDENLLIVDKPVKLESTDGIFSALTIARAQYGECLPVHRLDTNTEGLLMFAKNEQALLEIKNAVKRGVVEKIYHATVSGRPEKSAELEAYYKKENGRAILSKNVSNDAIKIRTSYKLLSQTELSILEVSIKNGKTHQIRAHLAFSGLPILGDTKYGNFEVNKKHNKSYQALRAKQIRFGKIEGVLSYLSEKVIE